MPSLPNAPPPTGSAGGSAGPRGPHESHLAAALACARPDDRRAALDAWAHRVAAALRSLGVVNESWCQPRPADDSRVVVVHAGGEDGACVVLTLGPERVELAVEVPPAELGALRACLADPTAGAALVGAVQALPEPFAVRAGAGDERTTTAQASLDMLGSHAVAAEREGSPLRIGWELSRETAAEHAAVLDEQLGLAVAVLVPILAQLARSGARPSVRPRASRPATATHAARGARTRRPIEKGARVRVLEGPFAGGVGVVLDFDSKGRARVTLGLLTVNLDVRDLAHRAEGRARPVLPTSHRKRSRVRS